MPKSSHPLLRSLGLAIRSRRRERGLSQEALADLANIDRSYMSSVERGLRNVSILNIARIAGALDMPLWELLRPRRLLAVAPRPSPEVSAWEAPHLLVGTEGHANGVPVRPLTPAPSSEPRTWEPRYLSLG